MAKWGCRGAEGSADRSRIYAFPAACSCAPAQRRSPAHTAHTDCRTVPRGRCAIPAPRHTLGHAALGGHTRSTCAFGRKSRSAGTGKIFFRNDQLTMARASPCQLIVRDRGMKNRRPRPAWRAAGARAETRCAEHDHGVAGANAAHISAHAITSCDAAQISPMHWIFHARRRFVEGGARCALFMPGTLREKSEPTPYPRQVPVFSRLRGRRPIACMLWVGAPLAY